MRGFVLAVILSSLLPSRTAGPLSLEACIRMAEGNDRTLRQREISLRESRTQKVLTALDWIPEISVGAGSDFNWGRSVDMQELLIVDNRMTHTVSFSANASLSLTNLALSPLRRIGDKLDERSAELAKEIARRELVDNITGGFLQVLLYSQACGICEKNCAEMESRLKAARVEADAGQKAGTELFELEAQLCRERSAATEAANRLKLAELTLKDYLDLPPEEELELLPPTGDSIPAPFIGAESAAIHSIRDPRVEIEETALKREENKVKQAVSAFLPRLAVSAGCGTYYGNSTSGSFRNQIGNNINPYAGVTLSIPITGGSANARAVAAAKGALARQRLESEKARRETTAAIRSEIVEAGNLYGSYISATENLNAAGYAESSAAKRFEVGEISGTEYLQARNARLRAEAELLQAKYRYLLKLKLLEYRYGIKNSEK